jgi:hypothetical protein
MSLYREDIGDSCTHARKRHLSQRGPVAISRMDVFQWLKLPLLHFLEFAKPFF